MWGEVDMSRGAWVIPAERMKASQEHRVPLSAKALELLGEAKEFVDGSGLVFPSPRDEPLSDSTLSKLLRELGVKAVPHGFRSSFRDWCAPISMCGARDIRRERIVNSGVDAIGPCRCGSERACTRPRP